MCVCATTAVRALHCVQYACACATFVLFLDHLHSTTPLLSRDGVNVRYVPRVLNNCGAIKNKMAKIPSRALLLCCAEFFFFFGTVLCGCDTPTNPFALLCTSCFTHARVSLSPVTVLLHGAGRTNAVPVGLGSSSVRIEELRTGVQLGACEISPRNLRRERVVDSD